MLDRRHFMLGTTAVLGTAAAPKFLRAQSEPIRIGLITTLSGPGQIYGQYIQDGCELAVDLINARGGVNGQPIELIVRDDRNSPDGALVAFRELAGDGVKLFAQGTFTANVLATLPLLEQNDVTMMVVGTSSLAITHQNYTRNMFRLGYSSPMCFGGYGHLMAERFPEISNWAMVRSDVQSLKDITDAFEAGMRAKAAADGREVNMQEPILVPYNGADFRNQISQVTNSGAEGLFNCLQGADAITYYKQARSFQMDKQFKLMCDSANELTVAKALGNKMLDSLWSWTGWYPQAAENNPTSDALLAAYIEKRDDPYPNWFVGVAHDCIATLAEAIGSTGSTAAADLIPAIEAQSFQGATGTVAFRTEDHSFAGDLTYIRFGKSESSETGWEVFESVQMAGVDFLEPATPGRELQ
ncbi:ABC transporter substrate-binding protein [Maritimibacter fusiformis]|uniref:ABC transporter substrate-binding protein n=1 Tax=Maritimibacter fusiformis TaxID=2603819 RepID=A0A5D0RKR8_9RHOB|nr:ABC transporter substrate-binding protein [Maritimibacter fusiformis]TYB82033.1 ABC transporter substrate-binding protein [Maritimibacter fusiformis]